VRLTLAYVEAFTVSLWAFIAFAAATITFHQALIYFLRVPISFVAISIAFEQDVTIEPERAFRHLNSKQKTSPPYPSPLGEGRYSLVIDNFHF